MICKKTLTLLLIFLCSNLIYSQEEDLFAELDALSPPEAVEVIAVFKSTRVLFSQSTERVKKKQLQFRVSHLFNDISSGPRNFFGLDDLTNMHLSFDWGVTDRIQLGLARTNKPDKTFQFSSKFSLMRQSKGPKSFPISISLYGGLDVKTVKYFPKARDEDFVGRIDYVSMLLISRKFSKKFSLQLSPSYLHRNVTEFAYEPNDLLSIGIGGRFMLDEHVSVNGEYFHALAGKGFKPDFRKNVINIGIDIETGGHVFQLYLSNATALHPGKFLKNDNKDFLNGQIQFGFSIMREFTLKRRKK